MIIIAQYSFVIWAVWRRFVIFQSFHKSQSVVIFVQENVASKVFLCLFIFNQQSLGPRSRIQVMQRQWRIANHRIPLQTKRL